MIDVPGEQSSDVGSYERAFGELQETITLLEAGGLTLQQAVETFERGMQLGSLFGRQLVIDDYDFDFRTVGQVGRLAENESPVLHLHLERLHWTYACAP